MLEHLDNRCHTFQPFVLSHKLRDIKKNRRNSEILKQKTQKFRYIKNIETQTYKKTQKFRDIKNIETQRYKKTQKFRDIRKHRNSEKFTFPNYASFAVR